MKIKPLNKTRVTRVRQWIKALRSGEYSQAQMKLVSPQGYCCLGVACEIAAKKGVVTRIDGFRGYDAGDEFENAVLPTKVAKWFGFVDEQGRAVDAGPYFRAKGFGNRVVSGISLNDRGIPFPEIADALEAWLDKQPVKA